MLSPNSKLLILVRHPESVKNLESRFSTTVGDEALTDRGAALTADLTEYCGRILRSLAISSDCCCIACSSSLRTKSAAEVTAAAIGCNIRVDSGLNAISAGSLAGMREAQARQFAPGFVDDLELYRAGVCNSYHLTGYGEDVQEFERRVKASLERLLGTDFKVVVVVGHRSSITASLIFLARLSLDYPENFYGYIPLDLGHLSAMFIDSDDITWVGVNLSAEELDCRLGPRRL